MREREEKNMEGKGKIQGEGECVQRVLTKNAGRVRERDKERERERGRERERERQRERETEGEADTIRVGSISLKHRLTVSLKLTITQQGPWVEK